MNDLRKAAEMALEFCEALGDNHWGDRKAVVDALRAALAQPEQFAPEYVPMYGKSIPKILGMQKPLTEEEIEYIAPVSFTWRDMVTFARLVEHEHGIGGEE